MLVAMAKKPPPSPKSLTTLPGFKVIEERPYIGPKGQELMLRYLVADGIADVEMSLMEVMHDRSKVDAISGIGKALVPNCCEECGGTKFVQMLVVKNGRVIEVLVCASGIPVYVTADRTKPCEKQHSVVRGSASGLTPSPQQIAAADAMLSRELIDLKRDRTRDFDDDPDKDGLDDYDPEDLE